MGSVWLDGDCYPKFYNARHKIAEDLRFVPIRLILAIAAETVLAVGRQSPTHCAYRL